MGKFQVENGKISGGEWEHFGWRNIFGGKCPKNGHRKFGVPGNFILQKSPDYYFTFKLLVLSL